MVRSCCSREAAATLLAGRLRSRLGAGASGGGVACGSNLSRAGLGVVVCRGGEVIGTSILGELREAMLGWNEQDGRLPVMA